MINKMKRQTKNYQRKGEDSPKQQKKYRCIYTLGRTKTKVAASEAWPLTDPSTTHIDFNERGYPKPIPIMDPAEINIDSARAYSIPSKDYAERAGVFFIRFATTHRADLCAEAQNLATIFEGAAAPSNTPLKYRSNDVLNQLGAQEMAEIHRIAIMSYLPQIVASSARPSPPPVRPDIETPFGENCIYTFYAKLLLSILIGDGNDLENVRTYILSGPSGLNTMVPSKLLSNATINFRMLYPDRYNSSIPENLAAYAHSKMEDEFPEIMAFQSTIANSSQRLTYTADMFRNAISKLGPDAMAAAVNTWCIMGLDNFNESKVNFFRPNFKNPDMIRLKAVCEAEVGQTSSGIKAYQEIFNYAQILHITGQKVATGKTRSMSVDVFVKTVVNGKEETIEFNVSEEVAEKIGVPTAGGKIHISDGVEYAPRYVNDKFIAAHGFSFEKYYGLDDMSRIQYLKSSIEKLFSTFLSGPMKETLVGDVPNIIAQFNMDPILLYSKGRVYSIMSDARSRQL